MEEKSIRYFRIHKFNESEAREVEEGLKRILSEEDLGRIRPNNLPEHVGEYIEKWNEEGFGWRNLGVESFADPKGMVEAYIFLSKGHTQGSKFYEIGLNLGTERDNSKYQKLAEKIQNYKEKISSRGVQ